MEEAEQDRAMSCDDVDSRPPSSLGANMPLKLSTGGRMEYSLEGALMAPRSRAGIRQLLIAVFAAAIAWHATAQADDLVAEIPDVTVITPRPPTDQELSGQGLNNFIVHHATVHYVDMGTARNLARW